MRPILVFHVLLFALFCIIVRSAFSNHTAIHRPKAQSVAKASMHRAPSVATVAPSRFKTSSSSYKPPASFLKELVSQPWNAFHLGSADVVLDGVLLQKPKTVLWRNPECPPVDSSELILYTLNVTKVQWNAPPNPWLNFSRINVGDEVRVLSWRAVTRKEWINGVTYLGPSFSYHPTDVGSSVVVGARHTSPDSFLGIYVDLQEGRILLQTCKSITAAQRTHCLHSVFKGITTRDNRTPQGPDTKLLSVTFDSRRTHVNPRSRGVFSAVAFRGLGGWPACPPSPSVT